MQKLSYYQKLEIANSYFPYFMEEFGFTEAGEKFSFVGREYLLQPYADEHPYQVHKKCTQVGITTKAIFSALFSCINLYPKGVLYLFPTEKDVRDFSRTRVNPIINYNSEISQWVNDADTMGLKQIKKSFLYLRGTKSRSGAKSIPADKLIADELDEMDLFIYEMARKRLSDSTFKHIELLSNPSLPDFAIDKEFQASDQQHYLLKCPHCGQYNDVNETFPDCLVERAKDDVILACFKCRKELDKSNGKWVAKYPSNKDVRGYQYTQLWAKNVTPLEILKEYRKAKAEGKLQNFYNLTLGLAYVSAKDRLTVEQVLSLRDEEFPENFFQIDGNLYMGIDQGKDLHIVFKKRCKGKILTYPVVEVDFKELDKYMKYVTRCVIDALPETRNAKAFAERFAGIVYLNYYNEHQKDSYKWDDERMIVQENRTESMDASHCLINEGDVVLPFTDSAIEYAQHCHNTAKKLYEDEETGSKRYVWVKLGPDHYRHADNYANIAMSEELSDINNHSEDIGEDLNEKFAKEED